MIHIKRVGLKVLNRINRNRAANRVSNDVKEVTTHTVRTPAPAHNFRVAVIGAGAMGRDHCVGLKTLPYVKICALVDRNTERLSSLQSQLKLPEIKTYNSVEDLLENEKLDLLIIASNTLSHLDLALQAVNAGVPRLIIEKPIGHQLEKAHQLAQLVTEKNIRVAVNHSRRWLTDYQAIKRCIAQGYIGQVRQIYTAPTSAGLGMMGTHFFDLMAFISESTPAWTIGFLDTLTKPNKRGEQFSDPSGYTLIGFKNGVRGYMDISDDLKRRDMRFIIRGDAGTIEVDERKKQWTLINDYLGELHYPFVGSTRLQDYCAKVAAEILSDQKISCGISEGIVALETLIAVYVSNQNNNRKVIFPLTEEACQMELPLP